jgi:hypothetical protein
VCSAQIFSDMQRELVLMTKPRHHNVLVVHGMYALRALCWRAEAMATALPIAHGCLKSFAAAWRGSAETPAYLLLAMDLWDCSARSLLDDRNRVLKVGSPQKQSPPPAAHRAPAPFGAQVSEVLLILREAANGLHVVHTCQARPPHRCCAWRVAVAVQRARPSGPKRTPSWKRAPPRPHLQREPGSSVQHPYCGWAHPLPISSGDRGRAD